MQTNCDVAIIGGGPGGSTVGALLKRHMPSLDVVIVERERFPRDHVGESHLPAISNILEEMGVWDKVEAADFPIKIGGTYRWGNTDELWDFEFMPGDMFKEEDRPAKFEGQRRETAFQVDRPIYDKILLDHAESLGCRVYQETKVTDVLHEGDRVTGFATDSPALGTVVAKHYVDGSGETGVLRRAMDVGITAPTALRNLAFWDYWTDAEWAVTLGKGGTRIQVMSLGWGWLWFIPISPTRTSLGLVVPGDYFKKSGKTKEELYMQAVHEEPLISKLVRNAKRDGIVLATKDWNFISDRITGDNWFLIGDACGFADPILSAGMTLAHTGARSVAYSILELERGNLEPQWVRDQYNTIHRRQIRQHMMFADYWYSANGRFTDLQEYCTEIAQKAGLKLNPQDAFRWLASGGFTDETPGLARTTTWRLRAVKMILQIFSDEKSTFEFGKYNHFVQDNEGVTRETYAVYHQGGIVAVESLRRGEKSLPLAGPMMAVHHACSKHSDPRSILEMAVEIVVAMDFFPDARHAQGPVIDAFETVLAEGWIKGSVVPDVPFVTIEVPATSDAMHRSTQEDPLFLQPRA